MKPFRGRRSSFQRTLSSNGSVRHLSITCSFDLYYTSIIYDHTPYIIWFSEPAPRTTSKRSGPGDRALLSSACQEEGDGVRHHEGGFGHPERSRAALVSRRRKGTASLRL